MIHDFFNRDGQKNLKYINNFKTHKYVKIVSFVGYERNYIEAIASDNKDSNIDVETLVHEIAPTAIIKDIFTFETKSIA